MKKVLDSAHNIVLGVLIFLAILWLVGGSQPTTDLTGAESIDVMAYSEADLSLEERVKELERAVENLERSEYLRSQNSGAFLHKDVR